MSYEHPADMRLRLRRTHEGIGGNEMNAKQTPLVDVLRLHAEDLYSDYGHNKSARLLSQAADEIERLRSNSLALEDEKNDYMNGVGDVLGQDHDGETLWAAAQRVMSECDRLREYAWHKFDCEKRCIPIGYHSCTCGYDELIKGIGGSAVPFSESDRD